LFDSDVGDFALAGPPDLATPGWFVFLSVELQLDIPSAPIKTTPISVSTIRPGVQKPFTLMEGGLEQSLDESCILFS